MKDNTDRTGSTGCASPKDFRLMVAGQIISILGSALLRFALSLYVLDFTGRADVYATLFAISNIALLVSPLGGAVADRFNRRNLMVAFDFTSSAIVFLYCLCLSLQAPSIFVTGAVMVLLSVISAMYQPAVTASIPVLVEEARLEQANGLVNGVQALSNVAAPVIGGIIYGMLGIRPLVLFSAAAFFSSAILELFLHIPFEKRELTLPLTATLKEDLINGFTYIRRTPLILKSMALAALLNMILTPFFVVGGPIILKVIMHSTDAMYGVGMGIINFATILGALSIGLIASRLHIGTLHRWLTAIAVLMVPMAVSVAMAIGGFGFYPSYLLFIFCSVPIAMILTVISIFVITKVQKETPNELLGKVMAVITAVSQCAAPVGQLVYGFLFQRFQGTLYITTFLIGVLMLAVSMGTKRLYSQY